MFDEHCEDQVATAVGTSDTEAGSPVEAILPVAIRIVDGFTVLRHWHHPATLTTAGVTVISY